MSDYSVVFDGIGNVSIPAWSATGDFSVLIKFTPRGTIATEGLMGNAVAADFVALFSDGGLQLKMSASVNYSAPAATIAVDREFIFEFARVGTLVTHSIKDEGTTVASGTFNTSDAFEIELLGDTHGLLYSGLITEVVLDRVGDSRRYFSTVNTGSVWTDTLNSQHGTLVGLPTDGSQWELVAGTGVTGIISTQANQNSVASASSFTAGAGIITTPALKNNTGTILASTGSIIANVYNLSNGALVLRKTGLTSNGSGVVTFSDVLLSAATEYLVHIAISTDDGVDRITAT